MKNICLLLLSIVVTSFAVAADPVEPPYGQWALTGPSGCTMTFELTRDGRIKRTTGQLEYTTTVQLIPEGGGWLLDEKLEKQNGQLSCNGQPGDEVVAHLEDQAFIERRGTELVYHGTKGGTRVRILKHTQPVH